MYFPWSLFLELLERVNQERGTRRREPGNSLQTQERVEGNFRDDEGRSQRSSRAAGVEDIECTTSGGKTPMLLNEVRDYLICLNALTEDL